MTHFPLRPFVSGMMCLNTVFLREGLASRLGSFPPGKDPRHLHGHVEMVARVAASCGTALGALHSTTGTGLRPHLKPWVQSVPSLPEGR